MNKLIEHFGQPKTTSGNSNIDPLIDPDVTRADYLQFKFLLNTHRVMNMQQFIKRFLADDGLCEQFSTFATLANIALIIPVSRASCERGFSCQNRIKTGLRNRLSKENLENLMKVAIEGPRLQNLILREQSRSSKGTVIVESSDSLCLTLTTLFCSVYLILSNDHTLVKSWVVNT